jgi:hypothetical protein
MLVRHPTNFQHACMLLNVYCRQDFFRILQSTPKEAWSNLETNSWHFASLLTKLNAIVNSNESLVDVEEQVRSLTTQIQSTLQQPIFEYFILIIQHDDHSYDIRDIVHYIQENSFRYVNISPLHGPTHSQLTTLIERLRCVSND